MGDGRRSWRCLNRWRIHPSLTDQNVRDGPFGRQAAFDQSGGGRCLCDTIGADAAGVFGTDGDKLAQLRRHDVQPLGAVLTDFVHLPAATEANEAVGFNDLFDPRQILRQIAAITFKVFRVQFGLRIERETPTTFIGFTAFRLFP